MDIRIFVIDKMKFRLYILILLFMIFAVACTKEIQVDIPPVESKLVVEGSIENGGFPLVLLTRSAGYFDPVDLNSLSESFVNGAEVIISNGENSVVLTEICSNDLPPELVPLIVELTGFSEAQLSQFNLCAYTTFDPSMMGEEGKTYTLEVNWEDEQLSSVTKIPNIIPLDSVWFEKAGNSDSLGFAHGILNDPDTTGNAYRWYTKRINDYPEGNELAGQQKDAQFMAPFGSVNDDRFFNGLEFEFIYNRPSTINSNKEDDQNEERGYFKVGDTIAVRGCTVDYNVYRFYYLMETQIANQGSPFAVPFEIETNINGGLGVWAGFGVFNDTIICYP